MTQLSIFIVLQCSDAGKSPQKRASRHSKHHYSTTSCSDAGKWGEKPASVNKKNHICYWCKVVCHSIKIALFMDGEGLRADEERIGKDFAKRCNDS